VGPETGLKLPSWANCTQVFTVDKARLQTRLGCVPAATLESIGGALAATLGLAQS
jgi:mRNA-degrading endonuclease toxin of MazEF toxin-antitoxin module